MEKASFKAFEVANHSPAGIAPPLVMLVAAFEASLALRYLVGLPVQKDKLYYLFFDGEGDLQLKSFLMPKE
jgi:adenylyltransferase/sulfurtransferase